MFASAATGEVVERRHSRRVFVDVPPVLMETADLTENVRLINIARNGLLAQTRLQYDSGQPVAIHLAGAPALRGRIAWWSLGMVGAMFAETLSDDVLAGFGIALDHPDLINPTAESRSNR